MGLEVSDGSERLLGLCGVRSDVDSHFTLPVPGDNIILANIGTTSNVHWGPNAGSLTVSDGWTHLTCCGRSFTLIFVCF